MSSNEADNPSVTTIGFTKTTAENFFGRLQAAGVRTVVDVKLNNSSQLAGFAKSADLRFFLKAIGNIGYVHRPELAPTDAMLTDYKKNKGDWREYETRFLDLMAARRIEDSFRPHMFDGACLLCSEDKPHHCHRRLVCDYLNGKWGARLRVTHL